MTSDSNVTIYHNPACSKSRQTLDILLSRDIRPHIILYLEHPPTLKQLTTLLGQLNLPARDLLRSGEPDYSELNLANPALDDTTLLTAMTTRPRLIQRPIVVVGDRAALGRPPENVLSLFE